MIPKSLQSFGIMLWDHFGTAAAGAGSSAPCR
jgi:hypothetical protein